jgi:hypothetical protein
VCTFAFGAGVAGLWIGLALGVSGGAVWLGRAQVFLDWNEEARVARANAALGGGHAGDGDGDGDGDDERAALVAVSGGEGDGDEADYESS